MNLVIHAYGASSNTVNVFVTEADLEKIPETHHHLNNYDDKWYPIGLLQALSFEASGDTSIVPVTFTTLSAAMPGVGEPPYRSSFINPEGITLVVGPTHGQRYLGGVKVFNSELELVGGITNIKFSTSVDDHSANLWMNFSPIVNDPILPSWVKWTKS